MNKNQNFLKDHNVKPMLSFLQWHELEQVAAVADYGAEKYSRDNWKNGKPDDYLSAALRHISARAQGQKIDESTLPHLAHAVCNLLFVMWMDNQTKEPTKSPSTRFSWGEPLPEPGQINHVGELENWRCEKRDCPLKFVHHHPPENNK